VAGLTGIFGGDLGVFNIFGPYASYRMYTVGYFLYVRLLGSNFAGYPYLAAFGVLLTLILLPTVLLFRSALEKFGPKTE